MTQATQANDAIAGRAKREAEEYSGDNPRPMGGYVVVLGAYGALLTLAAVVAAATGRKLPENWPTKDLLTVTLGTHKLSRTLTKDAVTSPLRAPFVHYAGTGGPAEVMEETRHSSQLRHSVGELVTCPFCLDMWVVTAFVVGLVFAPRLTRLVAGTFTALSGADFLQLAYAKAQQSAQQ